MEFVTKLFAWFIVCVEASLVVGFVILFLFGTPRLIAIPVSVGGIALSCLGLYIWIKVARNVC